MRAAIVGNPPMDPACIAVSIEYRVEPQYDYGMVVSYRQHDGSSLMHRRSGFLYRSQKLDQAIDGLTRLRLGGPVGAGFPPEFETPDRHLPCAVSDHGGTAINDFS
jgi:hypothetical protein